MEYKMKPIYLGMPAEERPDENVLCIFRLGENTLVLGYVVVFEYPTQYVVQQLYEEKTFVLGVFEGYAEVPNYEGGRWIVKGDGIYAEK